MKEQNHVDTTITTIEMCAGYGGIGLGIKRIFGERLRTIAYCELEGFAQANLISKMEAGLLDAAPLWSDLKTFPYAEFHGLVDILIAGYPCQPFSAAGKRAGKDDPRHLWPWIADGIRLLRPRMCFFENVEGHISLGLSTVISDLEELGYKVSWGIFSASEVGAPHQRKRVFLMAHDSSKGLEGFRTGSHEDTKGWEESDGHAWSSCLRIREQWPSRPGEPQYGWEPPRVVENSKLFGRRRGSDGDEGGLCGEIQTSGSCGGGGEAMGNTGNQRCEKTERALRGKQQSSGASEECGLGVAEAMGNASEREDHGRESRDLGQAAGEGRCGNDAADSTGEDGGLADSLQCRSDWRADRISWRFGEPSQNEADNGRRDECEVESPLGRDADGPAGGLGYAELQVTCDNRTDELRLLGNGVVPATAERAFRTLMEELQNNF